MYEQEQTVKLTREELYEHVWSQPMTKVAAEFRISDVALKKTCKRMNVPTPPRGYWAKLAVGKRTKKTPLPPDRVTQSRMEAAKSPIRSSETQKLILPPDCAGLHPVARELRTMLRAATAERDGRVSVKGQTVPHVTVSKEMVDQVARVLHSIIMDVESRGIPFKKARSKYDVAYFERGRDRLHLEVDEPIVRIKREPTQAEKRRPSWEWKTETEQPSGRLVFSIGESSYGYSSSRDKKTWTQSESTSIEDVATEVADGIWKYYSDLDVRRAEEEAQQKKRQEEYRIQQEAAAKQAHASALEETARTRAEDLVRAGEWWRIYQHSADFIAECERRWKEAQPSAELTTEQVAWLTWARDAIKSLSPFVAGYPDPSRDGPFDPAAVPAGGPYPPKRGFPHPPTMPKLPPPVIQQHSYDPPQPEKPYPFWLKYERR